MKRSISRQVLKGRERRSFLVILSNFRRASLGLSFASCGCLSRIFFLNAPKAVVGYLSSFCRSFPSKAFSVATGFPLLVTTTGSPFSASRIKAVVWFLSSLTVAYLAMGASSCSYKDSNKPSAAQLFPLATISPFFMLPHSPFCLTHLVHFALFPIV